MNKRRWSWYWQDKYFWFTLGWLGEKVCYGVELEFLPKFNYGLNFGDDGVNICHSRVGIYFAGSYPYMVVSFKRDRRGWTGKHKVYTEAMHDYIISQ